MQEPRHWPVRDRLCVPSTNQTKGMAMTTMTHPPADTRRVIGGIDTHKDLHVAAVLDEHGRGEQTVDAHPSCHRGDRSGMGVVVADELALRHAERVADRRVGQIKDIHRDVHAADASHDLELVDDLVDEVTEQFGPRGLLLIRGVPHARTALGVVATVRHGRVRARHDFAARWTLMPERAFHSPRRHAGGAAARHQT